MSGVEAADTGNTVTVFIGSYLDTDQMISSGIMPSMLANGDIGLNVLDGDMENATEAAPGQSNLVTELAGAWQGSGSGSQGMAEAAEVTSGTVQLTNTSNSELSVAAAGTILYAADGAAYEINEDPTNAAWTNGTSQTGSGSYLLAPGQTITVAVQATFQGNDAGSDASGSIDQSLVPGLVVHQADNLTPGGSLAVTSVSVSNGGHYYMNGDSYTPSLTFTPSAGASATGHVGELYVAGAGALGSTGSGYTVASNVAVDSPDGKTLFTINITSVSASGAILGMTFNTTTTLVSSIPATLSIVQAGASGGSIVGTNFGVSSVKIDDPGFGYTSPPTIAFSTAGSAPPASGVVTTANTSGDWLTSGADSYSSVFTNQGLVPAETYVAVNTGAYWTQADVVGWESYVSEARSVGVLNVAPLESDVLSREDPGQPFATSTFYSGVRQAALYGGGLEIQLPSSGVFTMSPSEWQTVVEETRWCSDNGIRSALLVENQGDSITSSDPNFAPDTMTLIEQLGAEDALPSQVVLENDSASQNGSYYDTSPTDQNALNAVALQVADAFALTPTAAEDGLEVRGASKAQTSVIMTGVKPSEDVPYGLEAGFAPYTETQVFSSNKAEIITATVIDTKGLLSLSDTVNGASAVAGSALTFSGVASQVTNFLNDLSAYAASGGEGVASLQLSLTDPLNQVTDGVTSVYLGDIHPTFASISETPSSSVGNIIQTGDSVTFDLATSEAVTVNGIPELVLTNGEFASYVGQSSPNDLLFSYSVLPGDDTNALRVRGLDLDGSQITGTENGLALDPDSLALPSVEMANPLVVNTLTDTITSVTEIGSASGVLVSGNQVTFDLGANSSITAVSGTPSLELSDGGIAEYTGLTLNGEMKFVYNIPIGGVSEALSPTSLNLNGAAVTNVLGEAVVPPDSLPNLQQAQSYNATNYDMDTLVIALSADEYLGDAKAIISINGVQVTAPIDVAAVHSQGQTQLVTVEGDFGSSLNNLDVSFTNDLFGGRPLLDRNLYVDQVTFDGRTEASSDKLALTSTLVAPIQATTQDELQLWVSEDASAGNAMFSVDVDGVDLPSTFSTNVQNSSGGWQEVDVYGSFGQGAHTVTITNQSDTPQSQGETGLYVKQVGIDGIIQSASSEGLYGAGSSTMISVAAPHLDTLTLQVSEDAWNGDAQCYVTVDGRIVGGTTTVTASHAAHAEQSITIDVAGLSTGTHLVGLSFINDAWGGTVNTDRNLYLDSVQLNGIDQRVSTEIDTWGTASFQLGQEVPHNVALSNITSLSTGLAVHTSLGSPAAATSIPATVPGVSDLHVSYGAIGSSVALLNGT